MRTESSIGAFLRGRNLAWKDVTGSKTNRHDERKFGSHGRPKLARHPDAIREASRDARIKKMAALQKKFVKRLTQYEIDNACTAISYAISGASAYVRVSFIAPRTRKDLKAILLICAKWRKDNAHRNDDTPNYKILLNYVRRISFNAGKLERHLRAVRRSEIPRKGE